MNTSSAAERTSTKRSGTTAKGIKKSSGKKRNDTLLSAVNDVVGTTLAHSVESMKERVSEQVAAHGERYLNDAGKRISEATAMLVKWGKKNPIKTAAAATALIAVSTFLYSTMGKSAANSK